MSKIKIGGFNSPLLPSSQSNFSGILLPSLIFISSDDTINTNDINTQAKRLTTFTLLQEVLSKEMSKGISNRVIIPENHDPKEAIFDPNFEIPVNLFYSKLFAKIRTADLGGVKSINFGKLLAGNLGLLLEESVLYNKQNTIHIDKAPEIGLSFYFLNFAQRISVPKLIQFTLDENIVLNLDVQAKRDDPRRKRSAQIRINEKYITTSDKDKSLTFSRSKSKQFELIQAGFRAGEPIIESSSASFEETDSLESIFKTTLKARGDRFGENYGLSNTSAQKFIERIYDYNKRNKVIQCEKLFSQSISSNDDTIDQAMFYGYNTSFLYEYINMMCYVYFNDLKLTVGDQKQSITDFSHPFIVCEYLLNLIYYAIKKEDESFEEHHILKTYESERRTFDLNNFNQKLKEPLRNNYTINQYTYASYKGLGEYTLEEYNEINSAFKKIYSQVIALDQTKEFLRIMYHAATFIGDLGFTKNSNAPTPSTNIDFSIGIKNPINNNIKFLPRELTITFGKKLINL